MRVLKSFCRNTLLLAIAAMMPLAVLPAAGCASLLPTPAGSAAAAPTSAQVGQNTFTIAAQGPPRQTLPQFLGAQRFLQFLGLIAQRIRNRLGMRFPGLEATPPLLSITDPANAQSSVPAVKAAAAAKAEEDAAPQKIKAMRYLAKLGCKECYPDTMKSLLAGLDDCTEPVRYEAAKALRSLTDGPCKNCANGTCCTPEVIKRLETAATGTNDAGLPAEPSERVRRMARMALDNCNCAPTLTPSTEQREVEGPLPTPAGAGEGPAEGPIPEPPAPADSPGGEKTAQSTRAVSIHTVPLRRAYDVVAARVNEEPIYLRDVAARVEQRIAELRLRASHQAAAEPALRRRLFREELEGTVDRALLVQEARQSPGFSITQAGFETSAGAAAAGNSSLAQALATEDELAEAFLRSRFEVDEQVTEEEIHAWYAAHREDFRRAGEVRWECVSATSKQFGSREAARSVLEELRRRAESPATEGSPSPELQTLEVESFDWTPPAGLPSPEIAAALRRLPVGPVSPIVEDAAGLHVVRVLARRAERLLSLEEAAPTIRAQIVQQRREGPRRAYVDQLRRQANVWMME